MNIDTNQVEALMLLLTKHSCDSITISNDGTITISKSLHQAPKREQSDKEKAAKLYGKIDPTKAADDFAARADLWATTKRNK